MKATAVSTGAAVAVGEKFHGYSVRNTGADVIVLNFRNGTVGGTILATVSLAATVGTQTVVFDKGFPTAGIFTEKVSGTANPVGSIYHS